MKICFVGRGLPRILPEAKIPATHNMHNLAQQLASMGHNVDVICPPTPNKGKQLYNVIEIGKPRLVSRNFYLQNLYELWYSLCVGLSLGKLQRQNNYDIIQFHENPATAFSSLIFAKKYIPSFIFSTGTPVSGDDLTWSVQGKRSLIWRTSIALHTYVFRHIENITTNSWRLKEVVISQTKVDPRKVSITTFNSVDPYLFHPRINSSELRRKFGLSEDEPVVLCLGVLAPYKNQLSLVKAIPDIIRKYPKTKFLFVGGMLKEYYAQIQQVVQANNLSNNVMFTGFVRDYTDLPKYYNLADIYVLLSRGEGNVPMTTLEAMACANAIVVSDIPQNREGAIHGDEMLLVNPYDIKAISNTVNRLLDDPDLRRQLGENAQRTIAEYYTPEVVAKRMVEVYEGIVKH